MGLRKKSAQKRIKTSARRKARNLKAKEAIKKTFKAAEKALAAKSEQALELVKAAVSIIDKAVEKNIIHRNKGARKKSRLMKKLKNK